MAIKIARRRALLASLAWTALAPIAAAEAIAVRASPVPLDATDPARVEVGRLRLLGGLHLMAGHKSFGGYSGMAISADGAHLRAVSDAGSWLSLRLLYDGDGKLAGVDQAALGPLRGLDGRALRYSEEVDAESLAELGDGSLLVGFERRHRIWRYPAGDEAGGGGLAGVPVPFPPPPDLHLAPYNEGLEGLALLADGRLLALSEGLARGSGASAGWTATQIGEQWQWQGLAYRLSGAFRVTDAAGLPDGGALVLERSFNIFDRFASRIVRIGPPQAGGTIAGEEIARLEPPLIADNFEAIAARRGRNGRIRVWVMSDDNFSGRQRTLLLHFVLLD